MNSLQEKLSDGKDCKVVDDIGGYKEQLTHILHIQDRGQAISVSIGGGGTMGRISFRIVKDLLKKGVRPQEITGNSAGSIIACMIALGYDDEKYLDYMFEGLDELIIKDNKYTKIPVIGPAISGILSMKEASNIILAKLTPFFCNINTINPVISGEEIRDLMFKNRKEFLNVIRKNKKNIYHNGKISEQALSEIIIIFLRNISGMGEVNLGDLSNLEIEVKKITFNNIYKEKLIRTGVFVSLPTIFRKASNGKRKYLSAIKMKGNQPILDSVIASADITKILKGTNIKGKILRAFDGFLGGKQFGSEASDFYYKDSQKIVIHTDPDSELNHKVLPKFPNGAIVISPDVTNFERNDTDPEKLKGMDKLASKITGNL